MLNSKFIVEPLIVGGPKMKKVPTPYLQLNDYTNVPISSTGDVVEVVEGPGSLRGTTLITLGFTYAGRILPPR